MLGEDAKTAVAELTDRPALDGVNRAVKAALRRYYLSTGADRQRTLSLPLLHRGSTQT